MTRSISSVFSAIPLLLLALCAGCPNATTNGDASPDAVATDAVQPNDTGVDTSAPDAALPDASAPETSVTDVVAPDSVGPDATTPDAVAPDASTPDTSTPDVSAPDASTPDTSVMTDASASDASATCSLVGTWNITFAGMTAQFVVRPDGSVTGLAGGGTVNVGTWSVSGSTFTLVDSGMTGCTAGDTGTYHLAFGADCNSLVLTTITDPCGSRSMAITGSTWTRVGGVTTDAGVAEAGGADVVVGDGGVCSIVGNWREVFAGNTLYFRFDTASMWQGALMQVDLGTGSAIALGNYTLVGNHLHLSNDPGGSISGCSATDTGDYTVVFGADCRTFVLTLLTDTCSGRSGALPNSTFTAL